MDFDGHGKDREFAGMDGWQLIKIKKSNGREPMLAFPFPS